MTNVNQSTSAANVRKLVKSAISAVGTVNTRFQEAGLAIMIHAEKYDDVTGAKELARACPKRMRNDLIRWFRDFSPIGINISAKSAADDKHGYVPVAKRNPYNIEGAKANPWFDYRASDAPKDAPDLKTLTGFWSDISSYIERQKKAISTDGSDGKEPKYSPDERSTMIEALATLETIVNKERAKSLSDKYAGKAFPPETVKAEKKSKNTPAGNVREAA